MHLRSIPVILALCALPLLGQFGNGGNGDLETTPMAIGNPFVVSVTGGVGQPFALLASDLPGPIFIGPFILSVDLFSPGFGVVLDGVVIPPSGRFDLVFNIPNDPFLLGIVLYLQALVVDPGHPTGFALSRGIRLDLENPDSFISMPDMSGPRALATGDALKDGRVLVAGGGSGTILGPVATNTTEIYQPFTRTWSPGPNLATQRAFHASATLNDGRILLCGGTSTTGVVTSTCEIFSPSNDSIAPAASMGSPRAGHSATILNDGRVLVTGGTSTFIGATIGPILSSSQDTGEVYDPVANTWTPAGNLMGSKRFVHSQTKLADGRVFCLGGISGSQNILGNDAPVLTSSISIYNPATNLFTNSNPSGFTAKAGHRATLMGNGEVFVAGGVYADLFTLFVPTATAESRKYNVAAGTWSSAGTLPTAIALQGQVLLKNGKCHLSGGGTGTLLAFTATNLCETRVAGGASYLATTPMPQPRGFQLAVLMQDGSILEVGGGDVTGTAVASTYLYTPVP